MLFTLVDTIHYQDTFDRDSLDTIFNAEVGVADRDEGSPWWIALLVVFDVLAVGGLVVWSVFLLRNKKGEANA